MRHGIVCAANVFTSTSKFRSLATRCTKRAAYYQAELTIAAIILWLR